VQVVQWAGLRSEISGQVGNTLVVEIARFDRALDLTAHQGVFAATIAVLLDGVEEVILVLAGEHRIGGVDRLGAAGAVVPSFLLAAMTSPRAASPS
jgi:hypothetical protein